MHLIRDFLESYARSGSKKVRARAVSGASQREFERWRGVGCFIARMIYDKALVLFPLQYIRSPC
jgi:hypothetical protein